MDEPPLPSHLVPYLPLTLLWNQKEPFMNIKRNVPITSVVQDVEKLHRYALIIGIENESTSIECDSSLTS